MQERGHDKLAQCVADDLAQHAPTIGAGLSGLAGWWASNEAGQYEMLFNLFGQGEFVATYGMRHAAGKDLAAFDLYRIAGGKIVEHWMNEEEIGLRETWGNTGKF